MSREDCDLYQPEETDGYEETLRREVEDAAEEARLQRERESAAFARERMIWSDSLELSDPEEAGW